MKRISKLMSWFLVLTLIFSLIPANSVEAAKKKVTVKKVKVSSSLSGSTKTVVVAKGKKVKLNTTVTVTPNKAANKKVSYTCKNKKIATVDKKGYVKGVKAGKTKITVTSKKNKKKKATITVKVAKGAVTKVTLNQTSGTINVGEKLTLKATVTGKKGADKSLVWKSSKESVATVNAKGEVTAVAVGTVTITAQAIDGSGKKATCTVTVQDPVSLKSVKVLSARSVAFSLNKAYSLTAGAVSVMKKVNTGDTYKSQLNITSMTTTDNINYTVVLGSNINPDEYVQVSIPSLTGSPKALETQYKDTSSADSPSTDASSTDKPSTNTPSTEAGADYVDYQISEWALGVYGSDWIGYGDYMSPSIDKLPAGLTATDEDGELCITGTPTAAGKTDAVVTAKDEQGNTVRISLIFIVGSSDVIVGAATPFYGVCVDNEPAYVWKYPWVTGGSGYYRYELIQDSKEIVTYFDSYDGELDCEIPAAGEYSVTVRVIDTLNESRYCDIVIPFRTRQGIVISGYVTDLQGNGLPSDDDNWTELTFINNNKTDLYCPYGYAYADSDGGYSVVVAPGTYDVEAIYNDNSVYLSSQSLTTTQSDLNITLPLVRVELSSDNPSVPATEFGYWYEMVSDETGEEWSRYCGSGNVVWLTLGTHTLTSKKAGRYAITATVDVNVTADTTQATAVVTVVGTVVGIIVAETPLSVTVTGDYMHYTFTPETDGTYYFWSEGDDDVEGRLEDEDGEELMRDDDDGPGLNFYFSCYCTAGQPYYVGIQPYDGEGTAETTIYISKTEPDFSDYEEDWDW